MTWKWWRRATRVNGLSHFFITCVAADVSSLKIYLSPSKNKKKKKGKKTEEKKKERKTEREREKENRANYSKNLAKTPSNLHF